MRSFASKIRLFGVYTAPVICLSLNTTSVVAESKKQKKRIRIGLIGAGPSGLSLLNAFNKELQRLDGNTQSPNFEVVCFEKQSQIGGLWNYSWRTATDEYGETVHNSMYTHLWSNAPKEFLELADYPFVKHFEGKNMASFTPRCVIRDYFTGRAKANELENKFDIRLNHSVINVEQASDYDKFKVSYKDMANDTVGSEEFDYLVVATGHFSTPNIVRFDGFDTFKGRILHSHSFRNAQEFKGQNILIIGSKHSAEDIALQCHKFGAKAVTISYRNNPINYKWPSNVREVPLLKEIVNEKDAVFSNGETVKDIDAVILCTGYLHHFPFLPDSLRLKTRNRLYPALYKGVVYMDNPSLFYLGMQDQWYTFPMFDVQSLYVKDVILDKVQLPNMKTMQQDVKNWRDREDVSVTERQMVGLQTDYIIDLYNSLSNPLEYTDDGATKLNHANEWLQWRKDKADDVMTYRDQNFTSKVSGITGVPFNKSWVNAFDDSYETFMNGCK